MLNQVILESVIVGNQGIKKNSKGRVYLCLSLSFQTLINSKGKWVKKNNFIRAFLRDDLAKKLVLMLKPGTAVIVRGKLNQNQWKDKAGSLKTSFHLTIDELHLMKRRSSIFKDE